MKFYALIGLGPNDVEITSLIFSSKTKAMKTLIPILGKPKMRKRDFFDKGSPLVPFWKAPNFENVEDENGDYQTPEIVNKFYTHYYGGCGECYAFILVPVQQGKPFAQFDLD